MKFNHIVVFIKHLTNMTEYIPSEVLVEILNHLPPITKQGCQRVCRLWNLLTIKPKPITSESKMDLIELKHFGKSSCIIPDPLFLVNDELYLSPNVSIPLPFLSKQQPITLDYKPPKGYRSKLINQVNGIYYHLNYNIYETTLSIIKDNEIFTFDSFYMEETKHDYQFNSVLITTDNRIVIHDYAVRYILEHIDTKLIHIKTVTSVGFFANIFVTGQDLYIGTQSIYRSCSINDPNQSEPINQNKNFIKYYKVVTNNRNNYLETDVMFQDDPRYKLIDSFLSIQFGWRAYIHLLIHNNFVLVVNSITMDIYFCQII